MVSGRQPSFELLGRVRLFPILCSTLVNLGAQIDPPIPVTDQTVLHRRWSYPAIQTHVSSFTEYRTLAIYHATQAILSPLDAIQTRFLHDAGFNEVAALMEFYLAPLPLRRDIAMLGMIHRAAPVEGPPQLRSSFQRRRGSYMLEDAHDGCKASCDEEVRVGSCISL